MKTAERYHEFKGPHDLPGMLRVKDVSSYMGINVNKGYEIFKRDDFNSIKLGGRYMVTKKEFLRWINEQSQK
jgi:hypothetical protein